MYTIQIEKVVLERLIESLIRLSEAYLQKAFEFEARHTPEGDDLARVWREKSHLAALDAHTLQLASQAQQA